MFWLFAFTLCGLWHVVYAGTLCVISKNMWECSNRAKVARLESALNAWETVNISCYSLPNHLLNRWFLSGIRTLFHLFSQISALEQSTECWAKTPFAHSPHYWNDCRFLMWDIDCWVYRAVVIVLSFFRIDRNGDECACTCVCGVVAGYSNQVFNNLITHAWRNAWRENCDNTVQWWSFSWYQT